MYFEFLTLFAHSMQVFIHDPLYKWALSPLKALQRQKVYFNFTFFIQYIQMQFGHLLIHLSGEQRQKSQQTENEMQKVDSTTLVLYSTLVV